MTYEAVDRSNGRAVAIKRFDVHGASSWKDVELAEREARVLSTLSHPALPEYVHHFEEQGALYLVMEKVDGQDLSQCMRAGHRFSFEELGALLESLADVFSYLHGRSPPVIHRDIKPSNIVRRSDGRYCLVDFGSVRDGLRPEGGSTVVGTFGYMAPEQFQGRALPASDLYGTGATLLTLLTGTTPDRLAHRGLQIDVGAALPASTSPAWIELLECLLSLDPQKRSVDLRALLPKLKQPNPDNTATDTPNPRCDAQATGSQAPGSEARREADDSRHHPEPEEPIHNDSEWIVGGGTTLPFVVIVALSILRLLLYLLLRVAVPLVLTLLSILFGRGLRQAAADVSNAGDVAQRQLSVLIERLSSSRPMVIRRRRRIGSSAAWDERRPWAPTPHPPGARSPKRRLRVGNFDVELPPDSTPEDAPAAHRRRRG